MDFILDELKLYRLGGLFKYNDNIKEEINRMQKYHVDIQNYFAIALLEKLNLAEPNEQQIAAAENLLSDLLN